MGRGWCDVGVGVGYNNKYVAVVVFCKYSVVVMVMVMPLFFLVVVLLLLLLFGVAGGDGVVAGGDCRSRLNIVFSSSWDGGSTSMRRGYVLLLAAFLSVRNFIVSFVIFDLFLLASLCCACFVPFALFFVASRLVM